MNVMPAPPAAALAGDSNAYIQYKRDDRNYLTQLFGAQLPGIRTGFFNVHMSKGMTVQPHWHPNASEMVFVIGGELMTSVFDPFAQRLLAYRLCPGQVCLFPRGWFHWIVALSEEAHFLAVFDVPTPDIVYGSDFLKAIPPEVMSQAYGVDPGLYTQAVAPIRESAILGPPSGRHGKGTQGGGGAGQVKQPGSEKKGAASGSPQNIMHLHACPFSS